MKKYKKGFTLSEILIVLVIIGMITALSAGTIKSVKSAYTNLAYFAHKNVLYNIRYMMSGKTIAGLQKMVTYCKDSDGKILKVLKNDYETDSNTINNCTERPTTGTAANTFCKYFVAFSNTSGSTKCETNDLYTIAYKDFTLQSGTKNEPWFSTLTENSTPNLILTNGMRIYISNWQAPNDNVSTIYGYRLVGVDLNGKTGPNKQYANDNKPVDIVTFLVLDNGQVYPLGVSADNLLDKKNRKISYINAKIKGLDVSRTETVTAANRYLNVRNDDIIDDYERGGDSLLMSSYRDAFCQATNHDDIKYTNYCTNKANDITIDKLDTCPPDAQAYSGSNVYSECRVKTVKPAFRYSF